MANTFLDRGERSIRMSYYLLANALAVLRERLPSNDPARRLGDPWLAHIEDELGYVLLDETLLEDREGVRRLRDVLQELVNELGRGESPPEPTINWKYSRTYFKNEITLDTCRRLVIFLDEVIADQEAEAAGSKRSP